MTPDELRSALRRLDRAAREALGAPSAAEATQRYLDLATPSLIIQVITATRTLIGEMAGHDDLVRDLMMINAINAGLLHQGD